MTAPDLLTHYILRLNGIQSEVASDISNCNSILECIDGKWFGNGPDKLKQKLEEFILECKIIGNELNSAERTLKNISNIGIY